MDRLSAYAARETESEPPEARIKTEEEATARLLERLRISRETKKSTRDADQAEEEQTNGTHADGEGPEEPSMPEEDNKAPNGDSPAEQKDSSQASKKDRGIPENVILYEIFYEQVVNLVNAQRLPIQDTTALLVSLANLAL